MRLIQAAGEMGEAIAVAKEIGRMVGGVGMLEAQRTSGEKERKVRSFHEIAVLYRTHRQGELLETCLRKEGIPYVVAGRESFLKDEKVRLSAAFFRCLLDSGQTAVREEASPLFQMNRETLLESYCSWRRYGPGRSGLQEKVRRRF